MENQAVEKARELLHRHPGLTFPLDMEELLNETGCELVEWPFLSPVKEVKHGRWIGIAAGLDQKERRFLAAHALGHHLLHCGNQLWFRDWQETCVLRQEREADEFAAHILMPETELEKLGNPTTWDIAEHFGVPEELATLRLEQFATERERECWPLFDEI
jgi:hypothetical protein